MSREQKLKCSTCGNPLTPLFFSAACDFCEKPNYSGFYRGWVVWRNQIGSGFPHYVFPNRRSAERWWRGQSNNQEGELRMVLSRAPFSWRSSRSPVRDYEFADHLFEIYEDHRFRAMPYRAFLAPLDLQRLYE